jgi:hypothetical protein
VSCAHTVDAKTLVPTTHANTNPLFIATSLSKVGTMNLQALAGFDAVRRDVDGFAEL